MGRRARARARGCGGTGAAQGVQASRGSETGGREAGHQRPLLKALIQTLLVYKHDIHKCLELVLPKGKEKKKEYLVSEY